MTGPVPWAASVTVASPRYTPGLSETSTFVTFRVGVGVGVGEGVGAVGQLTVGFGVGLGAEDAEGVGVGDSEGEALGDADGLALADGDAETGGAGAGVGEPDPGGAALVVANALSAEAPPGAAPIASVVSTSAAPRTSATPAASQPLRPGAQPDPLCSVVVATAVVPSAAAPAEGNSSGTSAASAASLRWPRSSHCGPYAARATPSSSVTKASAFSGRCSGCLARPRRISGRTGSGASVSGTGASMCWTASSAKFSPSYGLRPVRHSKKVAVAA